MDGSLIHWSFKIKEYLGWIQCKTVMPSPKLAWVCTKRIDVWIFKTTKFEGILLELSML